METRMSIETRESIKETYESIRKTIFKLSEFIGSVVYEVGEINFDSSNYDDEYFSINYDGGNHPEYESTCFSQVYSVYFDDDANKCAVKCEDGIMYVEWLNFDELVSLAEAIECHMENDHEEQNEMED